MIIRSFLLSMSFVLVSAWPDAVAAQAGFPDVVQLRDGSFVRGTIVERIEEDHVTIQSVSGELRTFPMTEVLFAGPRSDPPSARENVLPVAPQARGAERQASGDRVPLHAEPARHHRGRLTLHLLTGSATATVGAGGLAPAIRVDAFSALCTAPCDASLARGAYHFGVSENDGSPSRADGGPHTVAGPVSLELDYDNREGLRVAGWITFALAEPAAVGLFLGVLDSTAGSAEHTAFFVSSAAFIAVGLGAGLPLALLNDSPQVRVLE